MTGLPACDGCGQPMDAARYHAHRCPAYKDTQWRNPMMHKLSLAKWKLPGIDMSAKGSVLTGDQVVDYLQHREERIRPYRFPWILATLVGSIIILLWVLLG